jgi:hypothetical protein
LDRDSSHGITREELDCEEFREAIKQVLVPDAGTGSWGSSQYARHETNTKEAVNYCLRKADFNSDFSLSFVEFKSFLMVLRSKQDAAHTANLIFAMFDLDGDKRISQSEFREIYRYYLGHHPTLEDFVSEWRRLDAGGNDEVTRDEYIRWLQTSKNPIFKQHAPPVRGFSSDAVSSMSTLSKRSSRMPDPAVSKTTSDRSLLGLAESHMNKTSPFVKARWNQNFNTVKNMNHEMPALQRAYFSRPQSTVELDRYFTLHRGFSSNLERLKTTPELRRHKGILTTDSAPSLMPGRDVPGGNMRHPISGRTVKWNDHWQEPKSMKKKCLPVTLLFQCPGKPPPGFGEDD